MKLLLTLATAVPVVLRAGEPMVALPSVTPSVESSAGAESLRRRSTRAEAEAGATCGRRRCQVEENGGITLARAFIGESLKFAMALSATARSLSGISLESASTRLFDSWSPYFAAIPNH